MSQTDRAAEGSTGDLVDRYYLHIAPDDILDRAPAELHEIVEGHREFAALRPPGAPKVRVYSPPIAADGGLPHTVVEVVTDDMPFLVDSVTQELARRDVAIHLVVHPQLVVRRELTGQLLEILGTLDADKAPAGTLVESWMHIEVARQSGADAEVALRDGVLRVLRDVSDSVEDWAKMRQRAVVVADEMAAGAPATTDADEVAEAMAFLRWLADDHFTFLGYREYRLAVDDAGKDALAIVPGTGLGILRADKTHSTGFAALPAKVRERARTAELLVVTKANSRATVHRSVYLDYVGVKVYDESGVVVGERRFLGLFTSAAFVQSVFRIPLLRRKVNAVLERSGFPARSHGGKDLAQILEDHPREDMFQISLDDLYEIAIGVLHLQERRRLRLFMRQDLYGRFVSCLVYLPRERYSTPVERRMKAILLEALGGHSVDDTLRVNESVLARVHFVVRVNPAHDITVDRDALERALVAATRSWDDDFAEALVEHFGEQGDSLLADRYVGAFPEAYKEDFAARVAVDDLLELERLGGDSDLGLRLYEPPDTPAGLMRLKMYRLGAPVSLSTILPLLQAMGVEVVDERPYSIERRGVDDARIYDIGLRQGALAYDSDVARRDARFIEAFAAAWRGDAESDRFQALVLRAGLGWRQVVVVRAYAKYLRQGGSRFSQDYIESALVGNPEIARMLVELFEARLDPGFAGDRETVQQRLIGAIERALDGVSSLDEDRILRSFVALVRATVRTNYWQRDGDAAKPYLSLKFASESVPDLPEPRPRFEISVYSPRTEGVHLRFGPVSRGGIRYSDRREDFRTEVLGLAKTQSVKNAVIVPVGSKGGFVVKRPPADAADRDAQQAEVVACYCTLIRGLLDLTDNLVVDSAGRRVAVPPPDVVRHDSDDTYLVVAADKGTATFSDIANGIAADYGFWLGDAFASGGSVGYDHKVMGITARGAWESVMRHFRELGVDCQRIDFSCVGIGDMSGDVFGNGMLLSQHIKLVAAFDHRHVFVDPTPDPAASFAERARLFALPRSSWADYDRTLISAGGGVWPRSAKKIPVSAPMAAALGIGEGALAPSDLMRAILRAPVDLLWNGGIGTYVKSHTESHADVGDRANDAIRVDGRDLRCRVVGEGGNLGCTQLGRIEFSLRGGLVNTDAIDNSAGVDTSDHEVNIKILLDAAARAGELDPSEREPLLAAMTDEVGDLVLRDNYAQNVALSCSQAQASAMLPVHAAYIDVLERAGHVVRQLERLPDADTIAERRAAGIGLTRPELAVLLAYAKITTVEELVASDLPDAPFVHDRLINYFPTALRQRFAAAMAEHPLHREIVATQLANELVNISGSTFVHRLAVDTAAAVPDIVRAHLVSVRALCADVVWRDIELLDDVVGAGVAAEDRVEAGVQVAMLLDVRRSIDRASRWFLANRRSPLAVGEIAAQFVPGVNAVLARLPRLLREAELTAFTASVDDRVGRGVPEPLAVRVAALAAALPALSAVDIALRTGVDVDEVADLHFAIGHQLGLSRLAELVASLPRDTRWHALARAAARDDLQAAHAELTLDVLASTSSGVSAPLRIDAWSQANLPVVARATAVVNDIVGGPAEAADLATLSVALREVRTLVRTRSLPSG